MTEDEIIALIAGDEEMMDLLGAAQTLRLPNWLIGAGFVRNKVWDCLHGRTGPSPSTDIDLAYFDPAEAFDDKALEARLSALRPQVKWDIKNQATVHRWNGEPPCTSVVDALSRWPETATAVGVTLDGGKLRFLAPHGLSDLTKLIVRPSPAFMASAAGRERVRTRFVQKGWQVRWPRLKLELAP